MTVEIFLDQSPRICIGAKPGWDQTCDACMDFDAGLEVINLLNAQQNMKFILLINVKMPNAKCQQYR